MRLSKLLCFIGALTVGSCAQKPSLAFIDANIPSASARARVLFTAYEASFANGTATVTFTDGGGNILRFQLKGSATGLAAGSYAIDGAQNVAEATLIITSDLQEQTFTVNGTGGNVNVSSATVNGATITGFSGDFLVNFQDGGAGQGTFNTGA